MKVATFLFISISLTLAEPPTNYLPPSTQYGSPSSNGFASHTAAIIKPNYQYGVPNQHYGAPDNGYHGGYNHGRNGDYSGYDDGPSEPANYNFEYHVQDNYGNDFGHQEARQGDVAQGKYFVLLPDGRRQVVEYVADQGGYRPKVTYEGTSNGFGYNGRHQNGGGAGSSGYHY